jgi:Mannosyltransferase (PIG-V)
VGEFLTARRTRLLRAGLVISLWAFFQALVYLHRLGRELVGAVPARHALLLLASFPFAFFFSAAYAESLFLLAAVGAFYHFHQREWGRAALWGLLVGLSRPNGCLVSVPLAVLALSLARKSPAAEVDPPTNEPVEMRRLIPALLVAATPGVGMLAYTAWLRLAGGRWFMWMDAQAAWGREFHGIGWSLATFHRFLTSAPLYELTRYWPTESLDGIAAFGALALSWPIARRLGLAYGLLVPLTLVPPLFTGGFMSLGRMTATLFPLFLYLGWRLPDEARRQLVIVSLLLQGALAAIHFTWRPLV